MKKLNLDLFKLCIVALLTWLCLSVHFFSKNGRYQFINESGYHGVLDSRTGKVYFVNRDKKPKMLLYDLHGNLFWEKEMEVLMEDERE